MFSGLWAKITAGLTVVVGVLLAVLKLKNSQLEKAEHELKVRDKADEIEDKQDQFINDTLKDEENRINKTSPARSADDLNSL